MFLFLAGAVMYAQQAALPNPDFVTLTGLNVYDPAHLTSKKEIDFWILATLTLASEEDREALWQRLPGAALIIYPDATIPNDATACMIPPGYTLFGCTSVTDQAMIIAWRPCGFKRSSAAILAHELGHLLGYPHDHDPWYLDNRIATLAEHLVCLQ